MSAPQGSAEWLRERAGHCTASRFKDVLAKVKVGEAAGRRNYRTQLVTERMIGAPVTGGFRSAAMEHGTATEPLARLAYEAVVGEPVAVTGFHLHPAIEWCGCSPDGLVGDDGLIEIKCPEPHTHLEWLLDGVCPSEHIPQIQGAMFVTGRKFCDFVSFDPRFLNEEKRLLIVRVPRDDDYIAKLEAEIIKFLREVDTMHDRALGRGALAIAA